MNVSLRNGHSHCLLCGRMNPDSWGLSFGPGEGTSVRATLLPTDRLQGYDGMLHGGAIAAILDAAMTHCLFHRNVRGLTADLHVRFREPVSATEPVQVRAWIVSMRPPLYRLKAEILQDGQLMAWSEARFLAGRGSRLRRRESVGGSGP